MVKKETLKIGKWFEKQNQRAEIFGKKDCLAARLNSYTNPRMLLLIQIDVSGMQD